MLWASFNLTCSDVGLAAVCNTQARAEELSNDLQLVLSEGVLSCKQAQRLRGRMQFAEAQLFGRTGRRCLRVLSAFADGSKRKLLQKDKFFLSLFVKLLQQNVPQEVFALGDNNMVIFTDACYERGDEIWPCGIGGVLCSSEGFQYFSLPVDLHGRTVLGEVRKGRSR